MTPYHMDSQTAHAYCQEKAAASGSSFYYAFRFLPLPRRRAITAFYAFCREVDDIADECRDTQIAQHKLTWWRAEVTRLYAGQPSHPVSLALGEAIQDYGIPQEALEAIIDGMEMDIAAAVRYADFKMLNLYCHRVAGVVGEVAAQIFGSERGAPVSRATLKYANRLGLAFQLTNIVRDVGEDIRRDRIYLPEDELTQFGVSTDDLRQAHYTPAFQALMAFQIERAQRTYAEALSLLPETDRQAQRPGLIMAAIYRALLDEIAADGCRVLDRRYALTPLRKLWLAWKTWVRG